MNKIILLELRYMIRYPANNQRLINPASSKTGALPAVNRLPKAEIGPALAASEIFLKLRGQAPAQRSDK